MKEEAGVAPFVPWEAFVETESKEAIADRGEEGNEGHPSNAEIKYRVWRGDKRPDSTKGDDAGKNQQPYDFLSRHGLKISRR